MNISGCDCVPEDCEQADIAFQRLNKSTEGCFNESIPLHDVATNILHDAEPLRKIIDKLREVNPMNNNINEDCSINNKNINNEEKPKNNDVGEDHSFNYHKIKNDIKIETCKDGTSTKKQWCYYSA